MAKRICCVDECEKFSNSASGHCGMHLYRLKMYGEINPHLARQPRQGLICTIDECGQPRYSGKYGWCRKHYQRWLTHGDPLKAIIEMGSGDNVTVSAVHKRLDTQRGHARLHLCINCGGQAFHWSYDHSDPNEKASHHGPYSTDIERYQPRCVPCHKQFDLRIIDDIRSGVSRSTRRQ